MNLFELYTTVKILFKYDEGTGLFTRRVQTSSNAKVGMIAGSVNGSGAVSISINGVSYLAHRLAWLYHYGELPPDLLDHKDGVRTNNRINNLRLATHCENGANNKLATNNTSGVKGVCWHKASEMWRAQVSLFGKRYHVGLFYNKLDAEIAVKKFRVVVHGEFHNHGNEESI